MTATLITISIITSFLSGFSKAIMDLSEEGKIKFKPSRYWIKAMSSPNKWKDGDPRKGEKFFGSSRWFVMFTDAWHLFGFFYNRTNKAVGVCIGILSAKYSYWFLIGFIVTSIIYAGIFHLFYNSKKLTK